MQVSSKAARCLRRVPSTIVALGLLSAASAWAQGTAARGAAAEPPERTETQWLQAIQQAAERLSYTGTIVYHRAGAVQSSRVVHFFDGNVSHERLQLLDGKRREYVRRGTEVQCLYPDSRRVRFERRPDQESFPAIGAGAPAEILQRYKMVIGGIERVAGIECRVLVLEPRDSLRYGHWLCADRATALLLKAQTLNGQQEPIEHMAFVDLRIGDRFERSQLKPSWSTEGWTVEKPQMQPVDLDKTGWRVTAPEGFRKLRSVERKMPATDAPRSALQVVYSDGLASLSVFIEPGAGTMLAHELTHTQGPVSGFTRRVGDALVTVIGEVPPVTVRTVALSVTPADAARAGAPSAPASGEPDRPR